MIVSMDANEGKADEQSTAWVGRERPNIRTFVDPQNPTRVAMMDVPDMDALMAAMQSKAAADAMASDGVVPEFGDPRRILGVIGRDGHFAAKPDVRFTAVPGAQAGLTRASRKRRRLTVRLTEPV
jgi:hypothetical protein